MKFIKILAIILLSITIFLSFFSCDKIVESTITDDKTETETSDSKKNEQKTDYYSSLSYEEYFSRTRDFLLLKSADSIVYNDYEYKLTEDHFLQRRLTGNINSTENYETVSDLVYHWYNIINDFLFVKRRIENKDSIWKMNIDGSNATEIISDIGNFEKDGFDHLWIGKVLIFYSNNTGLYRYHIPSGKTDLICEKYDKIKFFYPIYSDVFAYFTSNPNWDPDKAYGEWPEETEFNMVIYNLYDKSQYNVEQIPWTGSGDIGPKYEE